MLTGVQMPPWTVLCSVGIAGVFTVLLLRVMLSSLAFQYDMMGRNQTAVREEMIRLANYLDSVSCISLLCCPHTASEQNSKCVIFELCQMYKCLFCKFSNNV